MLDDQLDYRYQHFGGVYYNCILECYHGLSGDLRAHADLYEAFVLRRISMNEVFWYCLFRYSDDD